MRCEIDFLECVHTANLKSYEYLYFAFNDSSEFEDEKYLLDDSELKTAMDEEMKLILKRQKQSFGLLHFLDEVIKMIQLFAYTKSFEAVNKHIM